MSENYAPPDIALAKVTPNLPANYNEQLAAEALAMAKRIGSPGGDFIRTNKDKTFLLPDGQTTPHLDAIVVDFVSLNQYYPGKYDPKDIKPPVCMAIGQIINEMKPFAQSPDKQNDVCHTCWANQWGTDGKGKACKNQRLLALLAPDMQLDGPLMLLKVAPTGTRFWDAHVAAVRTLTDKPPMAVVTHIVFDQNVDYASLRFSIAGPNASLGEAFGRRAGALERLLAEPEFAPADVAGKPAPAPAGKGKK